MAGSMTMAAIAASTAASMAMENQNQKKIEKQNRQYYDQQMSELNRQKDAAVRAEQEQLKRTQATHRARMAASGITPDEGSSGALLDGLQGEANRNIQDRQASYSADVSRLEDKSIVPTIEPSSKNYLGGTNSILNALQGWD